MADVPNIQAYDEERAALTGRVARRVREARREKGLPRRVLSERSGVSPRYLAQLEAGEGNISIALLGRVARALDLPIEVLIAQEIPAGAEALRIARAYARAPAHVRAEVETLLTQTAPIKDGRLCLIGLRGAGKSTLGARLADALGVPFVELSKMIEDETGIPTAEVLSLYGQDGYRRLEADTLDHLIARPGPMVLAVSGGFVEQEAPFATLLTRFHTIWLRASAAEHVERVRMQGELGPIRAPDDALGRVENLMQTRAPLYTRAEAVIETSGRTQAEALSDILNLVVLRNFMG